MQSGRDGSNMESGFGGGVVVARPSVLIGGGGGGMSVVGSGISGAGGTPSVGLTTSHSGGSFGGSIKSKCKISPYLRPFTKESLDNLEARTSTVIRDYGFLPRRNPTVADGSLLPNKYEPFPKYMYGRPLEEVDQFIFEQVSLSLLV